MNNRTSFALLAVLTLVGTLTISSAYAVAIGPTGVMNPEDAKVLADKMLLEALPVSVWTDKTDYGHNDIIMVKGQVANVSGSPITILVVNPLNSIVTIAQLEVAKDGSFETTLNTAGALWKYDGTYIIKVNYGSVEKSNKVKVELIGGVTFAPDYSTPTTDKQCGANDISASGQCIPYSISGGTVIDATLNTKDNSIVININAEDDGVLTITPSKTVQDGIFMVLVDGEEWDDVEIVANKVTIMFPAGAEQIEIIGTFVIPEFGTIAMMILAVAIISIIAISAKSRLSIIPRY
ncbi:MAG: PEFG-CTERM sorting domain-containing protein [Thaumarchaeota archaeon]|nr:PEFG-CTERM sorting domain-containing protein [Nitrososphaerota archaeon]